MNTFLFILLGVVLAVVAVMASLGVIIFSWFLIRKLILKVFNYDIKTPREW